MQSAIDSRTVHHVSAIKEDSRAAPTVKPFRCLFISDQFVFSIKYGNGAIEVECSLGAILVDIFISKSDSYQLRSGCSGSQRCRNEPLCLVGSSVVDGGATVRGSCDCELQVKGLGRHFIEK